MQRIGAHRPGSAHSGESSKKIRPEVQALRAVAVGLVVVYHFWPRALPGGYVGVDVFFGISGFLITSQLLHEVDKTGRVSLPGFWARRARRILPPALGVLLVCALATFVFVPMNYWSQFLSDMRASTEYGQNWHLAAAATNYFQSGQAPSPVQHYWSLSAEEQFYVVWPVLILLGVWVTRVRHLTVSRRAIALGMFALTIGSLAYGIYRTDNDPAAAYFITPTRAWEFGLGGLLALLPQWHGMPALRAVISWIGIAAIMVAAFAFSDATPFPGVAAALPVLGTIAVIWAGAPKPRWSPTPIVKLRPIQFIGDISYGIYLWHWPLLILTPFALGAALHFDTRIAIVILTVLAAWISKFFIEDPIRADRFLLSHRPRWTFVFAGTSTAVVFAVVLWGGFQVQAQIHKDQQITSRVLAAHPRCFGAASRDPQHPCNNLALQRMVVPTPVEAQGTPNAPCKITRSRPFVVCEFGVPAAQAEGTVALIGDSHASHWRAALQVVANDRHWHGLSITRSGCPYSRTVKELRVPLFGQCIQWNRQVPRWLARHPDVSTVFVAQDTGTKWVIPHGQNPFNTEVAGFQRAWKALPRTVKHIIVIRDTPKDELSTQGCVERAHSSHKDAGSACKVPRSVAIDPDPQAVAAVRAHSPRVASVDLNHFFCDSRWCYPVVGGALVHKDDHHLTVVFDTTLGPYLARAVDAIVPTTGNAGA
jgi:peptidoglycan/LPS O-acetylase OafA/YrhL